MTDGWMGTFDESIAQYSNLPTDAAPKSPSWFDSVAASLLFCAVVLFILFGCVQLVRDIANHKQLPKFWKSYCGTYKHSVGTTLTLVVFGIVFSLFLLAAVLQIKRQSPKTVLCASLAPCLLILLTMGLAMHLNCRPFYEVCLLMVVGVVYYSFLHKRQIDGCTKKVLSDSIYRLERQQGRGGM